MTATPRRLYLDLHILHTVPPSNLNRDDEGRPKTAIYGGAKRARVSSQAWKRATRVAFAQRQHQPELATRTSKVAVLIAAMLHQRTGIAYEDASRIASAAIASIGIKLKQRRNPEGAQTPYLLFVGRGQLERVVDVLAEKAQAHTGMTDDQLADDLRKLPIAELLGEGHPVDVALFGRMVADRADLNVDAACQVAHALSTHEIDTEFDYYTAIDDAEAGRARAGVIGSVEFTSATLYRYASIAVHQLDRNLADHDAVADAVELFIDSFTRSMPEGHKSSFAHRTLPRLVAVVLRPDQPVNLVSAFEEPIEAEVGIAANSAERLADEMAAVRAVWGASEEFVAGAYTHPADRADPLVEAFGAPVDFPSLLAMTRDEVLTWAKGTAS